MNSKGLIKIHVWFYSEELTVTLLQILFNIAYVVLLRQALSRNTSINFDGCTLLSVLLSIIFNFDKTSDRQLIHLD